jgi:hypothetical protein
LAKFQVSDPSGSIFKKFPKIAYTLTLWNQRPAIKLPIGVHYHIVIDIYCVDINFGSTHQRSDFYGQRFGCKKIKSLVKIFSMLSNGENWLFYWMCALNGWPAGSTEHIFRTHTSRSSIDVSVQFLVSPIPKERPVPWFQKKKKKKIFPIIRVLLKLKQWKNFKAFLCYN